MITYEDKIILDVLKRFDGMHKIDAYDILHKIEIVLADLGSPIAYNSIKKKLEITQTKNNIVAINKGGYCYLEDHCHFISVYRIKSVFPTFLGGSGLFFTTREQYRLIPYTDKEVRKAFDTTHIKIIVCNFLNHHTAKKRNPKTKRLLLLELFDQIDPE
ncbi:hypothetical protein ABW636_09535 [Aquimarina sp. 2201CG1-2-11]|uniref:hypothetical protein n=1 Tax=Aquimarina discodermiae TaxID=3231043 RepID=UPI00346180FD